MGGRKDRLVKRCEGSSMACTKPQEKPAAKDLDIACDSGCASRRLLKIGPSRPRAHSSTPRALFGNYYTTRHLTQGLRLRGKHVRPCCDVYRRGKARPKGVTGGIPIIASFRSPLNLPHILCDELNSAAEPRLQQWDAPLDRVSTCWRQVRSDHR